MSWRATGTVRKGGRIIRGHERRWRASSVAFVFFSFSFSFSFYIGKGGVFTNGGESGFGG